MKLINRAFFKSNLKINYSLSFFIFAFSCFILATSAGCKKNAPDCNNCPEPEAQPLLLDSVQMQDERLEYAGKFRIKYHCRFTDYRYPRYNIDTVFNMVVSVSYALTDSLTNCTTFNPCKTLPALIFTQQIQIPLIYSFPLNRMGVHNGNLYDLTGNNKKGFISKDSINYEWNYYDSAVPSRSEIKRITGKRII